MKMLGLFLARVGPLREMVGGSVMWLNGAYRGELLDVGCGSGQFLANMRARGWNVLGVEPDGEAVRVAREHFGLTVSQGTLEEVDLREGTFDAVTLNHVIEHVLDPVGILRSCRRVLKPGGLLVVVTPNPAGLGARFFGEGWLHWDPPRHLFLLSPQNLGEAAQRAGLQVVRLWTVSRAARDTWQASRILRRHGVLRGGIPRNVPMRLRLEGWLFWAVEYALCTSRPCGEEIVMIATKRDAAE
ncbi:hypothetical protein caldi_14550 [Caldinitratiruptor microaerophilus]|uniref:Class I SAM-dependent methyltransferase n=2 Tax=Caldinitratiruptor microaerophilus TaxID=671077 RepID=A0AA35G7X1_9FIRM|nr:hypothetical protein caldi_14550 [Caldinitratiruptor microaerophilus]